MSERSDQTLSQAKVALPVSPAPAASFLKVEVAKIEPCCESSGEYAVLSSTERSAGCSKMMVVRAAECRAAIARTATRASN